MLFSVLFCHSVDLFVFCCFLCQKRLNWCGVSFFMVSSNSWSSSVIIIVNYSRRQCHLTHKICYCCSYGRDGQKIPFRLAIKIKFNLCFRFIVAASVFGGYVCGEQSNGKGRYWQHQQPYRDHWSKLAQIWHHFFLSFGKLANIIHPNIVHSFLAITR